MPKSMPETVAITGIMNNTACCLIDLSAWDPGAGARLKQVIAFFKGSLTPDLLRQAFGKEKDG